MPSKRKNEARGPFFLPKERPFQFGSAVREHIIAFLFCVPKNVLIRWGAHIALFLSVPIQDRSSIALT